VEEGRRARHANSLQCRLRLPNFAFNESQRDIDESRIQGRETFDRNGDGVFWQSTRHACGVELETVWNEVEATEP
jgi:hypothetical protein